MAILSETGSSSSSFGSAWLTALKVPGAGPSRWDLAYPEDESSKGIVNVLCGANACGKSHILRSIHEALKECSPDATDCETGGVRTYLSGPRRLLGHVVFFGKAWKQKDQAGTVNLATAKQLPLDRPNYRVSAMRFLYRQLLGHIEWLQSVGEKRWLDEASERSRCVEALIFEKRLYCCDQQDPMVRVLQTALRRNLYFRRTSQGTIEFVLVSKQGNDVPFGRWSDGQQTLYHLLLTLEFERPSVLLVDELENHLHPSYMTTVLDWIRNRVPQTIIATHHPHLIFSLLVNRVLYIESSEPGLFAEPIPEREYSKVEFQSHPERTVVTLRNSYDKIAAAYRLFEAQDASLMRQASQLENAVETKFFEAVTGLFSEDRREQTERVVPDRQTLQVIERIRSHWPSIDPKQKPILVLDFGAGLGRLEQETAKLGRWQIGPSAAWSCWEPNAEAREELAARLAGSSAKVLDRLEDVPDESCDIVVIANVLHECNPREGAEVLYQVSTKLKPTSGVLLLLEICPNLSPEKFAMPYPGTSLAGILQKIGFGVSEESFAVHEASAYCLCARRSGNGLPPSSEIQKWIEHVWDEREESVLGSYESRLSVRSPGDQRALLQELTIVMTVARWRRSETQRRVGRGGLPADTERAR